MHSEYPVGQDMRYASGVNKALMKTTTKCLQIPFFFFFLFGSLEKLNFLGSVSMRV